MKKRHTLILATLVACALPSPMSALPMPENAEQQVANRDLVRAASHSRAIESVYIAIQVIRESFRTPINFEWSYVNDDRSPVVTRGFSFAVHEGDTLAQTLDRLCTEIGGKLQWGRIHDVICVWPSGKDGLVESTLDARISVQVNGVSTWEAMLEIARLVNEDSKNSRILMPDAEPRQDQYTPPLAMREAKGITLSMKDVTVREAICAVLATSPLRVEFTYGNFYRPNVQNPLPPTSTLSIRAFDTEGNLLYHVPESKGSPENYVWTNEARDVAVKPEASEADVPDAPANPQD